MISEELRKELIKSKNLYFILKESFNNLIDKVLLEENVNLIDEDGWSLLYYSVDFDLKDLTKLLLDNGIDVNVQNKNGNTSLIVASSMNKIEIVKLLLQYGADANIFNRYGITALDYAKDSGSLEIINILENVNSIIDEEDLKEEVKRLIKM